MAEFVCKFGTISGEIVERTYNAESERSLRVQMEQQGYYVFGIRRKFDLKEILKTIFGRSRRKVRDKEFLIFNQEFAALIHAGLPLLQCLQLLRERVGNPYFSTVLDDVYAQVKSGTALSSAFESHPDVFPPVYTASILSGEKSGTLEQVIRRYMGYIKILLAIRTKVVSSIIYPILLLLLSFAVIGVLVGYVIPKFSEFYKGFATDLPILTQILVGVAEFVGTYYVWVLLGLVVLIAAARFYIKSSAGAKRAFDRIKLRLPFMGAVWTKFSISQLTRTLHTLLAGGIPLVSAIDVAASSVGNRLVAEQLRSVSQNVKEGQPLWLSLQKTGLMTHMSIEMIKVGEETGALEEMLKNISDFYDEEIDTNLTNVLAVIEPVMLITMGLVIAAILLAMYYPLFTVYTTVK